MVETSTNARMALDSQEESKLEQETAPEAVTSVTTMTRQEVMGMPTNTQTSARVVI